VGFIVIIIFACVLWGVFLISYVSSKLKSEPVIHDQTVWEPELFLPDDGPDFYEYEEDGRVRRAEKGSDTYTIIYGKLGGRR